MFGFVDDIQPKIKLIQDSLPCAAVPKAADLAYHFYFLKKYLCR